MNRDERERLIGQRKSGSVPGQLTGLSGCLIIGELLLHAALFASPDRSTLLDTLPYPFSCSLFLFPSLSRPRTRETETCRASNSTPDRSILLLLRAAVFCSKPLHLSLTSAIPSVPFLPTIRLAQDLSSA